MDARNRALLATLWALLIGVAPARALPSRAATPWSAASYDSSRRIDVNEIDLSLRSPQRVTTIFRNSARTPARRSAK
jgi:hypothetical protein